MMPTTSLFPIALVLRARLPLLAAALLLATSLNAVAQVPTASDASDASDHAGLTGTAGTADFGGKLLLTGGVSQIEGSAGGGLTPWAVIGGYGTASQVGGNAHATYVQTQDFAISSYGAEIGIANRVELSIAHQQLNTRAAGAALGLGTDYRINMDTFGIKVRVLGDAILDQDTWVPQIAVGMQYKHNNNGALVKALGARSDSGTDFYVSATKLLLAQSLLLNGTLRMTKANQFGILGFGGDKSNAYKAAFEASAAYLLAKSVAVGVEYRMKPNNLGFAREQDAYDAFVAWAPTKHFSFTLAYVDLGDIATFRRQRGVYGSAQVGF
ncbi:DUF3034 family protein [Robbsia sp. KACC 23696]|uniref:DUF3034 family protein n=1 Tax=Robbsia sp. KACC 23696 TaxID=3149231 RepID=UPI00325C1B88